MVNRRSSDRDSGATYLQAGVDLEAAEQVQELIAGPVASGASSQVLSGPGAFCGLFDASLLQGMHGPVLVASTDGVGSKTQVAAAFDRYESIGIDLVHHGINDIAVCGARPLFFLDYLAAAHLHPEIAARVVIGVAEACTVWSCDLLGGETAELPGLYHEGSLEVAGTVVGVVERSEIIDGRRIREGDRILGIASSGLHTNGFSLVRHLFSPTELRQAVPELDGVFGDLLLAPHRCYLPEITRLRNLGPGLTGLAHVTGGGIDANLSRILPPGVQARLRRGSWPVPPIFRYIQRQGSIHAQEMARVFNMGLGLLAVARPDLAAAAATALHPDIWSVGEVIARPTGAPACCWTAGRAS